MSSAKFDPKWMWDLLTKQRKPNASDGQVLKSYGKGYKLFGKILDLLGNGYHGGYGWH